MKKYNVKNYIRYKEDIKRAMAKINVKDYVDYTDTDRNPAIAFGGGGTLCLWRPTSRTCFVAGTLGGLNPLYLEGLFSRR